MKSYGNTIEISNPTPLPQPLTPTPLPSPSSQVAEKYKMDTSFGRVVGEGAAKKLCKVEAGEEPMCEGDSSKWDDFVKKTNLPTLVQINGETFSKAVGAGLPLMIAAIKADNSEAAGRMLEIARESRSEAKYVFATIDRVAFVGWLDGFEEVQKGEDQYFVFDNDRKKYWVMEEGKDVTEFLRDVQAGKAKESSYSKGGSQGGFGELVDLFKKYLPWSCIVFVPFLLLIWVVFFDEPFQEEGGGGATDAKEGESGAEGKGEGKTDEAAQVETKKEK